VVAFGLADTGGVDGYGLTPDRAMDIRRFYRVHRDGSVERRRTRDTRRRAGRRGVGAPRLCQRAFAGAIPP